MATAPFVDDAQQSDAASGIDTQSGKGSEMNDEIEEVGGEAAKTIIDEINNNDEHSPAQKIEEKTIVTEESKSATPGPDASSTPIPPVATPAVASKKKEPQQFEEESKVHEDVSSDET